jgi:hypothetical protein
LRGGELRSETPSGISHVRLRAMSARKSSQAVKWQRSAHFSAAEKLIGELWTKSSKRDADRVASPAGPITTRASGILESVTVSGVGLGAAGIVECPQWQVQNGGQPHGAADLEAGRGEWQCSFGVTSRIVAGCLGDCLCALQHRRFDASPFGSDFSWEVWLALHEQGKEKSVCSGIIIAAIQTSMLRQIESIGCIYTRRALFNSSPN